MTIFKELLDQVSFEEIWAVLCGEEESPAEEVRAEYQQLFQTLKDTVPAANHTDMRIVLEEGYDFWGDNDEPYLQANGYVPGDDEPYALGFRAEEELVSFPIDPDTLAAYTPQQIVAQCLADYAYDTTAARTVWNAQAVSGANSLYESEVCMDTEADGSLKDVRRDLGLDKSENYKEKYGFLF